jgi:hypothetical protein
MLRSIFKNYMATQDNKDLQLYFQSLKKLKLNFDKISEYENTSPRLKKIWLSIKDTLKATQLKTLIDSVYQTSLNPPAKIGDKKYEPEKYKNDFEDFNIQTRTYADTIKKKGFWKTKRCCDR